MVPPAVAVIPANKKMSAKKLEKDTPPIIAGSTTPNVNNNNNSNPLTSKITSNGKIGLKSLSADSEAAYIDILNEEVTSFVPLNRSQSSESSNGPSQHFNGGKVVHCGVPGRPRGAFVKTTNNLIKSTAQVRFAGSSKFLQSTGVSDSASRNSSRSGTASPVHYGTTGPGLHDYSAQQRPGIPKESPILERMFHAQAAYALAPAASYSNAPPSKRSRLAPPASQLPSVVSPANQQRSLLLNPFSAGGHHGSPVLGPSGSVTRVYRSNLSSSARLANQGQSATLVRSRGGGNLINASVAVDGDERTPTVSSATYSGVGTAFFASQTTKGALGMRGISRARKANQTNFQRQPSYVGTTVYQQNRGQVFHRNDAAVVAASRYPNSNFSSSLQPSFSEQEEAGTISPSSATTNVAGTNSVQQLNNNRNKLSSQKLGGMVTASESPSTAEKPSRGPSFPANFGGSLKSPDRESVAAAKTTMTAEKESSELATEGYMGTPKFADPRQSAVPVNLVAQARGGAVARRSKVRLGARIGPSSLERRGSSGSRSSGFTTPEQISPVESTNSSGVGSPKSGYNLGGLSPALRSPAQIAAFGRLGITATGSMTGQPSVDSSGNSGNFHGQRRLLTVTSSLEAGAPASDSGLMPSPGTRRVSRKSSGSSTASMTSGSCNLPATAESGGLRVLPTMSFGSPMDLRQFRLEKKATSILNRVKRLQAIGTEVHVAEEIRAFVGEWRIPPTKVVEKPIKKSKKETDKDVQVLEKKLQRLLQDPEFKKLISQKEELKNKSYTELAKLIKKHEGKFLHELLNNSMGKNGDVGCQPLLAQFGAPITKPPKISSSVPKAEELRILTDVLLTHAEDLKKCCDSDATDSSSGGESCDEWDGDLDAAGMSTPKKKYLKKKERPKEMKTFPKLRERPQWWYHEERSWLGSRWGWLQSYVADLEYKIRQHVDIVRQLRARKSLVQERLKPEEAEETCARQRPVVMKKRRNLVRTTGMHRWNRKTARLSTAPCFCFPPVGACVMCSGRVNNTLNHPDVCIQPRRERVAILDQTFHPVLSDRNAIALDKKIQCLLKYESCVSSKSSSKKGNQSSLGKKDKDKAQTYYQRRLAGGKDKKNKLEKLKIKLGGNLSKKKYEKKNAKDRKDKKKKKLKAKSCIAGSRPSTPSAPLTVKTERALLGASGPSSPAKPPGKLGAYGRRSTISANTYDIDDIVIDPSAMAMAKVEKLQYKEIQTPKWRESNVSENLATILEENETEDLDDGSFAQRHYQKECEEKRRFQVYKESIWTPSKNPGRRPSHATSSADTPVPSPLSVDLPAPVQSLPPLASRSTSSYGSQLSVVNQRTLAAPIWTNQSDSLSIGGQSTAPLIAERNSTESRSPSPFPVRTFPLIKDPLFSDCQVMTKEGEGAG